MSRVRITTMCVGIGLIGLTSGCTSIGNYVLKQALDQREPDPQSTLWETEKSQAHIDQEIQRRQAQVRELDRQYQDRYQGVRMGMDAEQVLSRLGRPSEQSAQYIWSTMEGNILIHFDTENQAVRLRADNTVSTARRSAIQELVQKQASYNTIAANLGGDPSQMPRATMTWDMPPQGKLRIQFRDNQVVSRRWQR